MYDLHYDENDYEDDYDEVNVDVAYKDSTTILLADIMRGKRDFE